jgi:hypothetical protein
VNLFRQRHVRHLRDIDVFFNVPGFFFERDQPLDRVGLDARVLAEKRRGEVV